MTEDEMAGWHHQFDGCEFSELWVYLTNNVEHLLCFECVVGSGDIILRPQFLLSWVLKLREKKGKQETGLIKHFLVY